MNPQLSVILPAYNEGREIEETLKILTRKLDGLNIRYEVIVVDDGSKDDTKEQAAHCADARVKVLSYQPNRGKGHAIRYGMNNASGDYRLFMDVDLSTSLDAIDEFLTIMRTGECDILIGDRKSRAQPKIDQPFVRRFFGRGFTILSALCIGRTFVDITCGFKMFNRKAAEIIFPRQKIDNWSFDAEILCIAVKHGLKIKDVPVKWSHNAGSNVRVVRDIITSLYGLMKILFYSVTGAYR